MASYPNYSLFTTGLVAVSVVFPVITSLFVALRVYVRKLKAQPFGWDDWTCIASLIFCWAMSINLVVFAALTGIDTTKFDPNNPYAAVTNTFKFFWVNEIFFSICLGVTKISVLLFYRRLFSIRYFKIVAYIMVWIIAAWTIAITLASIFMADPIDAVWNNPGHYRIDYNAYSLACGGMSLGFDAIILLMPLFVIQTLQMPLQRKIGVMLVFWLGSICFIAAAVRLRLLWQGVYEVNRDPNQYTLLTKAFYWAELEPNMAVVAASLPSLRPLFSYSGKGNESILASWWGRSKLSTLFRSEGTGSGGVNSLDAKKSSNSNSGFVDLSSSSTSHLQGDIEMNRVAY